MTTDLRNGSRQESRPSTTGPRAAAHRLIPKQKCVSVCVRESCCVRVRVCRCVCMSAARMSVCVYVRRESLVTCTHRTALINILYFTRGISTQPCIRYPSHLISNNVSSSRDTGYFRGASRVGTAGCRLGTSGFIGSGAIFQVRGGLAPLLAPGRGTYGSVWPAAFQRCKRKGVQKYYNGVKCERFPILCRSGAGTW